MNLLAVHFTDLSATGTLRLSVTCRTSSPTASPVTTMPTQPGMTFSPTTSPPCGANPDFISCILGNSIDGCCTGDCGTTDAGCYNCDVPADGGPQCYMPVVRSCADLHHCRVHTAITLSPTTPLTTPVGGTFSPTPGPTAGPTFSPTSTPTVSLVRPGIGCSSNVTAELSPGGMAVWTFMAPANGGDIAQVVFSNCDPSSQLDTLLYVAGKTFDDHQPNCTGNERVMIPNFPAGVSTDVVIQFYSPADTGTVRLGVICNPVAPTLSPTHVSPSEAPMVAPSILYPAECAYGAGVCLTGLPDQPVSADPDWFCCMDKGLKLPPVRAAFLPETTRIHLSGNEIERLPSGAFCNLTALADLELQFNKLTVLNNDVFCGLTALTKLLLMENLLTRIPIDTFSDLRALTFFRLGDNQLGTLQNNVLSGLSALASLQVPNSKLTYIERSSFSDLRSLEALFLYGNILEFIEPNTFSALTSLTLLILTQNRLTMLPTKLLWTCTALKVLDIVGNNITRLPVSLVQPDPQRPYDVASLVTYNSPPITLLELDNPLRGCRAQSNVGDGKIQCEANCASGLGVARTPDDISAGSEDYWECRPFRTANPLPHVCATELARISSALNNRHNATFYVGEQVSVPGFIGANCSRSELFENVGGNNPDRVTFSLRFDDPFAACCDSVAVSAPEGCPRPSNLGTFSRVPGLVAPNDIGEHPAYINGLGQYLVFESVAHYWYFGSGIDGSTDDHSIHIVGGYGRAKCPTLVASWLVWILPEGCPEHPHESCDDEFPPVCCNDGSFQPFKITVTCADDPAMAAVQTPGEFVFANGDTGALAITADSKAENRIFPHARLVATDLNGNSIPLVSWTMRVDKKVFHVANGWNQTEIFPPDATFTVDQGYDFAGINRTKWNNRALFGNSELGKVVFFVEVVNATDSNATVYTNNRNGSAIARIHAPGSWTLQLSARDESKSNSTVVLGRWAVKAIPIEPHGSVDATSLVAVVVLAGLSFVLTGAFVVSRVQLYRANRLPQDFDAMQTEILERLGLGLPTDIGPQEFGVTLTLEDADSDDEMLDLDKGETYEDNLELQPMLPTATTFNTTIEIGDEPPSSGLPWTTTHTPPVIAYPETSEDDLAQSLQFQQDLMAALTKVVPSLAPSMQQVRMSTLRSATLDRAKILVVMPQPRQQGDQAVVAALSAAAAKRQLVIGLHVVSTACLAIPRQVPREISRKDVLRIAPLGQGSTAEVHKYQLAESHRGTPPFLVAAKTVKAAEDGGATRTELLEEAAMLALLDHRNILPLVGVITVPRDLPALVLLMYCERGTLKDHVEAAGIGGINTVTLLTFCAEVLQGMQHIASRRIVHRDIAARNVLLDANEVCKLADFGQAVALADIGKDYAKLSEELPIRHAAVEVLQSGRFSTASDVWSFGCLAWEVFSAGADPYPDIASFTEVSSFVRAGKRMTPPSGQPVEIHQRLMLPCWAASPADRPMILNVYAAAVSLGAIPDDQARDEMQLTAVREKPALGSHDKLLRGPSVHHLTTVARPGVFRAVVEHMPGGRTPTAGFDKLKAPEDGDIWHMVESFIKPASAGTICPHDGEMGCAYVDTLSRKDNAGKATALLSYAWGYKFAEVLAALETWTTSTSRDPKRTYFWVCSFCLNQHGTNGLLRGDDVDPSDPKAAASRLAKGFYDRIVGIGRILPMLEPWDNPGYVKRAWCLFELYTAVTKRLKIDIILSASETERFRRAIRTRGYGVVDAVLDKIDGALAISTHPEELALVRKEVLSHPGGMPMLNETVKLKLREWFQSQGGIGVARRQSNVVINRLLSGSLRQTTSLSIASSARSQGSLNESGV